MRSFVLCLWCSVCFLGCADGVFHGPNAVAEDKSPQADQSAVQKSRAKESKVTNNMQPKYNKLTEFEKYVLLKKGTERPFVGKYTDTDDAGTYICRRCNAPLYRSDHKFHSNCGWPAFDDELPGSVTRLPDADGFRTEIVCSNCGGHLGHVFLGERLTAKNTRHCVNSVSMQFIPRGDPLPPTITKNSKSNDSDRRRANDKK